MSVLLAFRAQPRPLRQLESQAQRMGGKSVKVTLGLEPTSLRTPSGEGLLCLAVYRSCSRLKLPSLLAPEWS